MSVLCTIFLQNCHETATVISLSVESRGSLIANSADDLKLSITHETEEKAGIVLSKTNRNSQISLGTPVTVVVRADGRQGNAQLTVQAILNEDSTKRIIGLGSTTANILSDETQQVRLLLSPETFSIAKKKQSTDDFTLSTEINGPTFGRQIAGSPNYFVIAFRGTGGKSIINRVYDLTKKTTTLTPFSTETNVTTQYNNDQPAIAMKDNSFVIVWQQCKPDCFIVSRRYTMQPDDKGLNITVSSAQTISQSSSGGKASAPHVAPLANGNFQVVWQEQGSNGWRIKSNGIQSNGLPTRSTPLDIGSSVSANPNPVIAVSNTDEQQGFMVVWQENGNIKGKVLTENGNGSDVVEIASTGNGQEPTISPHPQGYAVLWSDTVNDTDQDIQLRIFDNQGNALDSEYTLNTTTIDNQRSPAIAMQKDGTLMAVWFNENEKGLRGIFFDSTGQRLGYDFPVSTLTPSTGTQDKPSITSITDGFAIIFMNKGSDDNLILGRRIYTN